MTIKEKKLTPYEIAGRRFGIFLIIVLLITSGFTTIVLFPGFAAYTNNDQNDQPQTLSGPRAPRGQIYDMNLSRPGFHQSVTVNGWRQRVPQKELPIIQSLAIGDINGDNYDDLIIGAPGDNDPFFSKPNSGRVNVIFGQSVLPSSIDLFNPDIIIFGNFTNDSLGRSVAVGDFNGDGIGDLVSGAPGCDCVYVIYGGSYLSSVTTWDLATTKANLTIEGNVSDSFGVSLAVTDLSGDNFDDLIIGAPLGDGINHTHNNCGEVTVIYGFNLPIAELSFREGSLGGIDYNVIFGNASDDHFGAAVAAGSDFNGDGLNDIAVTAPFSNGNKSVTPLPLNYCGSAYVLYWRPPMPLLWNTTDISANFTFHGKFDFDLLGNFSVTFGDVNNDSFADLLVGAHLSDFGAFPFDFGTTHVLFGSDQYSTDPYEWSHTIQANVTIIYIDNSDESGTWVDAFDWSGDGIDDIIVTAPYGDGPANFYNNVGELAIFNGSDEISGFIPADEFSIDYRFIGADDNDTFGRAAAHGDMDGDGITDLAVLADNADGVNNQRNGSGEVYVISPPRGRIPSINALNLTNGDGLLNNTCYTKYKPYEFRVNITPFLDIKDLTNVTITLDPAGLDLIYSWDRVTDTFFEVNDPNNYAELLSTSANSSVISNNWILSFIIDFDWNCSITDVKPVFVKLWSHYGFTASRVFPAVFQIENRLNFTGNLVVKGQDDRILANNDWVRGTETINWTGLTVVYENSTGVYPRTSEYWVKLWNATDSWIASSSPGTSIDLITQAGSTSLSLDAYTLNITKIPSANDVSAINFQLRVDAENITFSNPIPTPGIWQTKSMITCGITVSDTGGTQVDGSSIEYRTSEDNGTAWSNWLSAGVANDDVSIQVSKDLLFNDGAEHVIQWRGRDTIGNGLDNSMKYQILVDTENVTFTNASPLPTQTIGTKDVTLSIDINDNTSGVAANSIAYKYSTDNGDHWSGWINVGLVGIQPIVKAEINVTFKPGSDNLVVWRADDVAGNGPRESAEQRINIYLESPELKVFLSKPDNNSEIGNATPKLRWICNDNSSNIVFDVYLDTDYTKAFELSNSSLITAFGITTKNYIVPSSLVDGKTYYWTVIPRNITGIKGICVDNVWNFKINLEIPDLEIPKINLLYPDDNDEITTLTPTFIWNLTYINPSGLLFDLSLGTSQDALNMKIPDISFPAPADQYEYTWDMPLDKQQFYFWRVSVHGGDLDKVYYSDIWEFFTNVEEIEYDFNLESNRSSIQLKQGTSGSILITAINLESHSATIDLSITSANLPNSIFNLSSTELKVSGDGEKSAVLIINIPEDFEPGTYKFSIKGTLVETDLTKPPLEIQLTVTPKSDKKDGDGDGEEEDDLTMAYAAIAIVIVIIIVLLLLFLFLKRKKKAAEEPGEGVEEPEKPPEALAAAPMAAPVAPVAQPPPTEPVVTPEPGAAPAEVPAEPAPVAPIAAPAEPQPTELETAPEQPATPEQPPTEETPEQPQTQEQAEPEPTEPSEETKPEDKPADEEQNA